jgi:hypothetical protein
MEDGERESERTKVAKLAERKAPEIMFQHQRIRWEGKKGMRG